MTPRALIIHHSASATGDRDTIDGWHKARGWKGVGYHKILLRDGRIQQGRADNERGAHCPGWNDRSLGICCIGNFEVTWPTQRQWASLERACAILCQRHSIPALLIYGHKEVSLKPTACPGRNFDLNRLREEVEKALIRIVEA